MTNSLDAHSVASAIGANAAMNRHYEVAIIGGGQAGLSMSYHLKRRGINHLVIEKRAVMSTWRRERWDSFTLVTPNWQCDLPDYPYQGDDPYGFMNKAQIDAYLTGFTQHVSPPVVEGVVVERMSRRAAGGFHIKTSRGELTADQVVVASGGYHTPIIPRMAERISPNIVQIQSSQYRNAESLPDGAVFVVGSGQSGAQIAEDLHLAGRKVVLALGDAPRCARFYRGKDVVEWLSLMNYYEMPVDSHPLREGVRDNTNHYVTGRDGGRDIDLRRFANEGMELYGLLTGLDGETLTFSPDVAAKLDAADAVYNGINASIDKFIAEKHMDAPAQSVYEPVWTPSQERTRLSLKASGISSIVWCIGFSPDFTWLDIPVFNGRGYPGHVRGVTTEPGLYFLGLPWLHTWGSGRFSGVAKDALFLAEKIEAQRVALVKISPRVALAA